MGIELIKRKSNKIINIKIINLLNIKKWKRIMKQF